MDEFKKFLALNIFVVVVHAFIIYTNFLYTPLLIALLCLICPMYWILSVDKRMDRTNLRSFLLFSGYLLLFYAIIQNIKYYIVIDLLIVRYLWYLYYIPMIFIPLFGYYSSKYIGFDTNYKLKKIDYAFLGISILLIFGVLTNEYHNLCFRIHLVNGIWDNHYSHGPFYYTIVAWIAVLMIEMIVILYKKCSIESSRKKVWIPVVILGTGIIYTVLYISNLDNSFIQLFPLPIVFSSMSMLIWESFIYSGLIPSNSMHKEVFEASTIAAQITDEDYNVDYSSVHAQNVSKALMVQSENNEMILENNIRMKNQKIQNGHILWFEDISYMNSLLKKSQRLQNQLFEENDLLKAETTLRAREQKVKTQSAIYTQISHDLSKQIDDLSYSLEHLSEEEALKKACVIGAYIKRKANLILLGHSNSMIESKEMGLCIRESLNSLQYIGIEKGFIYKCKGHLYIEVAELFYDFFEEVIEKSMDQLESIFVNLYMDESLVVLKMVLEGNVDIFEIEPSIYQNPYWDIDFDITKEDSVYISFNARLEAV